MSTSPMPTTLNAPPMSLLRVDFAELYARHLCRHSQFGINVVHLIALFGVWFGVYATIYWLTGVWWLPVALAASYFALVALNAPARVGAATAVFLAVFLAAVIWLPELPLWVYIPLIPACYQVQSWSHRVFTAATDMTDFNRKYPKGSVLFVVLLINEIPLLLNYLCYDRKRWRS
jgi:hypothetical protein